MGQKVNPISLRLGINRGWDSVWFAKKREYGKFLIEDYKIREYIKKKLLTLEFPKLLLREHQKNALFLFTLQGLVLLLVKRDQM